MIGTIFVQVSVPNSFWDVAGGENSDMGTHCETPESLRLHFRRSLEEQAMRTAFNPDL